MASDIDVAVPPFGNATTAGVRANFAAAKAEIEDLQRAYVLRLGSINELSEIFQQCTVNDVGQPVQFNTQLFNNPPAAFTWDSVNHEIVIEQAGWYSWALAFHIVRKVSTGAVDWTIWAQVKEPLAGSFSNYAGSGRRISLPADEANGKLFQTLAFSVHTPIGGTRIRFMQACTDVSKQVGIISYPAAGNYPSISGVMLSINRINLEE